MRGRVNCLYCGEVMVWRDGAWRLVTTGDSQCKKNQLGDGGKHRIAPA